MLPTTCDVRAWLRQNLNVWKRMIDVEGWRIAKESVCV